MSLVSRANSDEQYQTLETVLASRIASLKGPLFYTEASGLFDTFLSNLPSDKQHYNCHCCRRFIERYGSLVSIDPNDGNTYSSIFCVDAPLFFYLTFELLKSLVENARVTGVFINDKEVWGIGRTGAWTHLHGPANELPVHKGIKTASQVEAEKSADYQMLMRALLKYKREVVEEAVRVLRADVLFNSEKTLGNAEWFLKLHQKIDRFRAWRRENIIWHAVATAPAGWCHINTNMIHTLMDDIIAGKSFEQVKHTWGEKMHPLQYRRPQAPPSDGQIDQANKIVEQLGAAGSLRRRFATINDVNPYWLPVQEQATEYKPGAGVFDHLKKPEIKKLELPPKGMSWTKFRSTILPTAKKIDFLAPAHGNYYGMVTAVNPEAPCLLKWGNHVSWFIFYRGSSAEHWSLSNNTWVPIQAICALPPHWNGEDKFKEESPAAMLILKGCALKEDTPGGLFFPESLKAEYHPIRKAMEAYSKSKVVEGRTEGTANGYMYQYSSQATIRLKVNGTDVYVIEEW